jgi:hypothetical protein
MTVLAASGVIQYFSTSAGSLDDLRIAPLVDGLTRIETRNDAVSALLYDQIIDELCPWLINLSAALVAHDAFTGVRVILRLIEICRYDYPSIVMATSAYLTPEFEHDPITIPDEGSVFQVLSQHRPWTSAVVATSQEGLALLERFITEKQPLIEEDGYKWFQQRSAMEEDFESIMIAFGRAIGIALELDSGLAILRLHPSLVFAIYDLSSQSDASAIAADLGLPFDLFRVMVAEPVFFVLEGIRDVLGPAGLLIFTVDAFEDHCGIAS